MALCNPPTPPDGYSLVVSGLVRFGDIAFGGDTLCWGSITPTDRECLGTQVAAYYAIARYTGPGPRLARIQSPSSEPTTKNSEARISA